MDNAGRRKNPASSVYPDTLSEESYFSAPTLTAVSEYERTTYYNGITGDCDHPDLLLYRSDLLTNPFTKPKGRYAHLPSKSVHRVYNNTSLILEHCRSPDL